MTFQSRTKARFSLLGLARIACLLFAVIQLPACEAGTVPSGTGRAGCDSDAMCSGGTFCHAGDCRLPCEDDDDCDGELGRRLCRDQGGRLGCEKCTSSDAPKLTPGKRDGAACYQGAIIECADDDGTACRVCGCAEGLACVEDRGCIEPAPVGDPCETDAECESDNCSAYRGVCRVAVGEPCTGENCDLCYQSDDGTWSFCSADSCDKCGDHACIGFSDLKRFWCRPSCEDCPGECVQSDDGIAFCDCNGADGCAIVANREVGHACHESAICAEGSCRGDTKCALLSSGLGCTSNCTCFAERGVCTTNCFGDADCADGAICVDGKCLRPCALGCALGGSCRDDGGDLATPVCDGLLDRGQPCLVNASCASNSCSPDGDDCFVSECGRCD